MRQSSCAGCIGNRAIQGRKAYARINVEEEREQIETSLDEALFPVLPGYPSELELAHVEQVVFAADSVGR